MKQEEPIIYSTLSLQLYIVVWVARFLNLFLCAVFTYHSGQNINLLIGSFIFFSIALMFKIERIDVFSGTLCYNKLYAFNLLKKTREISLINFEKAESTPDTFTNQLFSFLSYGKDWHRQLIIYYKDGTFKEIKTFISLEEIVSLSNVLNERKT